MSQADASPSSLYSQNGTQYGSARPLGQKLRRRILSSIAFLGILLLVLFLPFNMLNTFKTSILSSFEDPVPQNSTVHRFYSNTTITAGVETTKNTTAEYRLELLHIPKTGGTMLEVLAAKYGIVWGACHFEFPWKYRTKNVLKSCPPIDTKSKYTARATAHQVYWHYPLHLLPQQYNHAYDNLVDSSLNKRTPRFFVVVRNPYDRLISAYYMKYNGNDHNNATAMNGWFHEQLQQRNETTCSPSCLLSSAAYHLIPQFDFIWNNGTKMVHHVLRFENLHQDFQKLRKLYSYLPTNLTIPQVQVNPRHNWAILNRTHLSQDTLKLIHSKYEKDFGLGGGYERIVVRD